MSPANIPIDEHRECAQSEGLQIEAHEMMSFVVCVPQDAIDTIRERIGSGCWTRF